jgi:methyl coenzyme M reductase gamma subunit
MKVKRINYPHDTYLLMTTMNMMGCYVGGCAICADGKKRKLKRIAATADTFFSIPAAVTVAGKTVTGFITTDDDDGVRFHADTYRKNAGLLSKTEEQP